MRKKVLAGNWKMHMLNEDLHGYFESFHHQTSSIEQINEKLEIIFGGPFTLLSNLSEYTKKFGFAAASQNCHFENSGAFTGEISTAMLTEIGISTVIIGHSERRQYFNETESSVGSKVKHCLSQNFTVIACVGETSSERKSDKTQEVLERQIQTIMEAAENPNKLIIAYEPVWAIGTGLVATTAQAQEAHKFIRELLSKKYGTDIANSIRILYGGSMKPENIAELISQPDIDGGLVGGASLKAQDFAAMATIAASH